MEPRSIIDQLKCILSIRPAANLPEALFVPVDLLKATIIEIEALRYQNDKLLKENQRLRKHVAPGWEEDLSKMRVREIRR